MEMNSKGIRWQQRLSNYRDALNTVLEFQPKYKSLSPLEQDGLLQRFEYTFELAWKVMQDYLTETGYKGLRGPRNVIKQMGHDDLLNPFVWEEMMAARNQLSHIYDNERSRTLFDSIINNFIPAMQEFEKKMSGIL
jgi:nucleotidyltransferase substrate binding protein (TIGR01987 family)